MIPGQEAVVGKLIKSRGLKITGPRKEILDFFFRSRKHLSPEELFIALRRLDPKIGRATVYRTLKVLKDAGLAAQVDLGDGSTRVEPAHDRPHHDHLICTACGRLIEFTESELEKLQENIARRRRFHSQRHRLEIYGLCAACFARHRKRAGRTAGTRTAGRKKRSPNA